LASAAKFFRTADGHYERLVREDGKESRFRYERSTTQQSLASIALALGRAEEADRNSREAVETQQSLAQAMPGILEYRVALVRSMEGRALLLQYLGRFGEEEGIFRAMIKRADEVFKKNPKDIGAGMAAARERWLLAQMLEGQGKNEAALAELDSAVQIVTPLAEARPPLLEARHMLCSVRIVRGVVLGKTGPRAAAAAELDRAQELARDDNPSKWFERAVALVRIGEAEKGLKENEQLMADPRIATSEKWFFGAHAYARAADPEGGPATPQHEAHARRALELLRKAREEKVFEIFENLLLLRLEPALNPIRQREEFKKFLKEIEERSAGTD
jgi:tetratricopeptide (TPR) repeat protein